MAARSGLAELGWRLGLGQVAYLTCRRWNFGRFHVPFTKQYTQIIAGCQYEVVLLYVELIFDDERLGGIEQPGHEPVEPAEPIVLPDQNRLVMVEAAGAGAHIHDLSVFILREAPPMLAVFIILVFYRHSAEYYISASARRVEAGPASPLTGTRISLPRIRPKLLQRAGQSPLARPSSLLTGR